MRLTEDEKNSIDGALEKLKGSLKEELEAGQNRPEGVSIDDPFVSKIADRYLSASGVVRLIADARFLGERREGCVCGCSCAEESKGLIWY